MSQRPPIEGTGTIQEVRETGRLYDVVMANGYVAIAVIPRDGPQSPEEEVGARVRVAFSPYDMSRSKVIEWLGEDA